METQIEIRGMWGCTFHQTLRKSLDSKASSIMWNAWHLIPDADTVRFSDAIYNSPLGLREAVEDIVGYGNPAQNLFMIGLEMMDDTEIEVIERYAPRRE
jgi:hypothetical protein